jgi:hypothetical protein
MEINPATTESVFEAPRLTLHGTVADLTNATVLGVNADQTIAAGSPVIGKTSL